MTGQQTESETQAQQPQRGNGSELSGLVMRLRGTIALMLIGLCFWLPLILALRETAGIAWRWARQDVPKEYARWWHAIKGCTWVVLHGKKLKERC